jgi:hypothetical protein
MKGYARQSKRSRIESELVIPGKINPSFSKGPKAYYTGPQIRSE